METLEDVILGKALLEIRCGSAKCGTINRISAHFFAARYGLDAKLDRVGKRLVCPAYGTRRIALGTAAEPSQSRQRSTTYPVCAACGVGWR